MKKRDGIILLEAVVSVFLCVLLTFFIAKTVLLHRQMNHTLQRQEEVQKEIQKLLSDEKGETEEYVSCVSQSCRVQMGKYETLMKCTEITYEDQGKKKTFYFLQSEDSE